MLLSDRKWEILKKMEEGEKTPSQLAEELDVTISTISRHLKGLKEKKLVERCGNKKGKTRSYQKYRLKDAVYFLYSLDGRVKKEKLEMREYKKIHFRIWSLPQEQFQEPVERLWCRLQDKLEEIDSFLIYGSVARGEAREDSDIDVLFISNNKQLEKDYKAKVVGKEGKGKLFMAQVFSREDFEDKLKSGSDFAENILKEGIIIYDPENYLKGLKDEYE